MIFPSLSHHSSEPIFQKAMNRYVLLCCRNVLTAISSQAVSAPESGIMSTALSVRQTVRMLPKQGRGEHMEKTQWYIDTPSGAVLCADEYRPQQMAGRITWMDQDSIRNPAERTGRPGDNIFLLIWNGDPQSVGVNEFSNTL